MHFYCQHHLNTKIQKHIYFLAYNYKTKKYLSRIILTLLHCDLFYSHHHILFYLHLHLVRDNHSVELGTQDKEVVLQVAWRRTTRAFLILPREFDIKPRVPSWGKFTLVTKLCTWSPDELAPLFSVIKSIFWRRCQGTKEIIHNCYLHRVKAIHRREIFFTRRAT
jgi:hypothetical protein